MLASEEEDYTNKTVTGYNKGVQEDGKSFIMQDVSSVAKNMEHRIGSECGLSIEGAKTVNRDKTL